MSLLATLLRPRLLFNRGVNAPLAAVFALLSCAFASSSSAQSCVQPTLITQINTAYLLDTCASSYHPSSLCGDLFPATPAVVYQVNLGYPSQGLTVNVAPSIMTQNFDPVVVIQSRQCGTGECPIVVDAAGPGGTEQVGLGQLDSGVYFIVVTSLEATCGTGSVSINGFTENDTDGILRSGFDI